MNAVSFTAEPFQKARTLDPNFQLPNRRTISGWHLGTFSEVLPVLYSLVFTVPTWVIFPDFFCCCCCCSWFCSDLASYNKFCILVKTGPVFLFLIKMELIHRGKARLKKKQKEEKLFYRSKYAALCF